jgi:NADH dehydrogenase
MRPSSTAPYRIVMLGGGYVTVWAYRSLLRKLRSQLRDGHVELTVVCPENYHAFHGWTGEVLGGIVALSHHYSPLRSLLKQAKLVRGEAIHVDLHTQTVTAQLTGEAHTVALPYDELLFGTGSRDRLESVSDLARHGWRLKATGDLLAFRNHLITMLEQADALADADMRAQCLAIVIGGGGFAGVEMCAAIAEWLQTAQRYYPALRTHPPKITLVHTGPALLPQFRPRFNKLADYATRQLQEYSVNIRLNTRITQVTPDGALLEDGSFIPAATVVSTIGQMLAMLPGTEALPRDAQGRLLTDETLRVVGHPNLWAGGDVAHVLHVKSKTPCPSNALWAIKHGEHAGNNIARALTGAPLRPFTYPGLGQAASLGVGKGATELYGMQFTGWIGWLMRLCFFLYFMPSRVQAVRVALDWLSLPVLGRCLTPFDHPVPLVEQAAPEPLITQRMSQRHAESHVLQ